MKYQSKNLVLLILYLIAFVVLTSATSGQKSEMESQVDKSLLNSAINTQNNIKEESSLKTKLQNAVVRGHGRHHGRHHHNGKSDLRKVVRKFKKLTKKNSNFRSHTHRRNNARRTLTNNSSGGLIAKFAHGTNPKVKPTSEMSLSFDNFNVKISNIVSLMSGVTGVAASITGDSRKFSTTLSWGNVYCRNLKRQILSFIPEKGAEVPTQKLVNVVLFANKKDIDNMFHRCNSFGQHCKAIKADFIRIGRAITYEKKFGFDRKTLASIVALRKHIHNSEHKVRDFNSDINKLTLEKITIKSTITKEAELKVLLLGKSNTELQATQQKYISEINKRDNLIHTQLQRQQLEITLSLQVDELRRRVKDTNEFLTKEQALLLDYIHKYGDLTRLVDYLEPIIKTETRQVNDLRVTIYREETERNEKLEQIRKLQEDVKRLENNISANKIEEIKVSTELKLNTQKLDSTNLTIKEIEILKIKISERINEAQEKLEKYQTDLSSKISKANSIKRELSVISMTLTTVNEEIDEIKNSVCLSGANSKNPKIIHNNRKIVELNHQLKKIYESINSTQVKMQSVLKELFRYKLEMSKIMSKKSKTISSVSTNNVNQIKAIVTRLRGISTMNYQNDLITHAFELLLHKTSVNTNTWRNEINLVCRYSR